MNANRLPVHLEHAINQFKDAATILGQLGFVVFAHAAIYTKDGEHFTTLVEADMEQREPILRHQLGHALGDAVRCLSGKWDGLTRGTDLEVSIPVGT